MDVVVQRVVGTGEIHTATTPFDSYKTVPLTQTVCEVPGQDPPASSPFDCHDPSPFRVDLVDQAILPTQFNKLISNRFVNVGLLPDPSASYTFHAQRPSVWGARTLSRPLTCWFV